MLTSFKNKTKLQKFRSTEFASFVGEPNNGIVKVRHYQFQAKISFYWNKEVFTIKTNFFSVNFIS